ncbi:MAG: hypothetical protein IJQ13_04480 [Prevotella sp.]|nr:hypothetical protein [Prevotella sp.]
MNYSALGTIAGTATSWIGNGIATFQANKGWRAAINAAEDRLEDARRRKLEAIDHRNKVYYQDPTQTAESQAAVAQAQELLDENTRKARASGVVSGATDESVALQKGAGAQAVGNMVQQQAVNGAQKKDQYWENWQAQDNALENEIDLWQRYKADTEKAKYLSRAQSIQNTANMVGASMVDFGQKLDGK